MCYRQRKSTLPCRRLGTRRLARDRRPTQHSHHSASNSQRGASSRPTAGKAVRKSIAKAAKPLEPTTPARRRALAARAAGSEKAPAPRRRNFSQRRRPAVQPWSQKRSSLTCWHRRPIEGMSSPRRSRVPAQPRHAGSASMSRSRRASAPSSRRSETSAPACMRHARPWSLV